MAKVAFVDDMTSEKLGVLYLASVLKEAGHTVEAFLRPLEPDFIGKLKAFSPDVVGIGSFLGQEVSVIEIFRELKQHLPNTITLQGGPSTLIYDELIYDPCVDLVLKGDAEDSLLEVVELVAKGESDFSQVPGLLWKSKGKIIDNGAPALVKDFGNYPAADRSLFMKYESIRTARTKSFVLSRGCPYPCTFCGTATLNKYFKTRKIGNHFRYGAVDRIIDEIKFVRDNYGLEWVQFHDATFNANPGFLKEVLERYIQEKLPPFICNIRSENVKEEQVELLKRAGCDRVTIGIQSGNAHIRKDLSGRSRQTNENILEACHLFRKHKIRVGIDLIFGWPGEKLEESIETIELARAANVDKFNCNVMIYYPDAPITKYAHENGYLDEFPSVFDIDRLANPYGIPLRKTPDLPKLINLDKLAYLFIKNPWLCQKPILEYLLSRSPNTLYIMAKRFPGLLGNLKYDARDFGDQAKYVFNFLTSATRIRSNQVLAEARSQQLKKEIEQHKQQAVRILGNLKSESKGNDTDTGKALVNETSL